MSNRLAGLFLGVLELKTMNDTDISQREDGSIYVHPKPVIVTVNEGEREESEAEMKENEETHRTIDKTNKF